uniref:DDE Tnp4 domain-containing protein n=1 Tax=Nicotiana tabacum TaxID=4097 RepID=A0A1S4D384_TOBAC|nr:PREDICTED: uncharacterized protein LOC107825535 [Nicotiana tabacum]
MRGETWLGWDATKNMIMADDDWWERKIKNEKYKKFRNKDLLLIWFRYDALFAVVVATGERARATNQEQSSGIGLNLDEEGINVIDNCDKEHFTYPNDEMSDESNDLQNINSVIFSESSLKRQKSTDGVSTSSQDCIGALDDTHVKARFPQGQEISYIGRKVYLTQNILGVVDFNMCFTFVWAGWEGVAHDSRIFGEALRRPELNFSRPIRNKYYLVDVVYPHMKGYMAPYKGDNVRYHLAQFRHGATRQLQEPRGRIEKFNYLHSSCKNIVESTFGVWKTRWSILRDMPFYHIDTQGDIVLATMAIHNYIRKKCNMDDAFRIAENERYIPSVDPDVGISLRDNNNINAKNVEDQSDLVWMGLRDLIANEICDTYSCMNLLKH